MKPVVQVLSGRFPLYMKVQSKDDYVYARGGRFRRFGGKRKRAPNWLVPRKGGLAVSPRDRFQIMAMFGGYCVPNMKLRMVDKDLVSWQRGEDFEDGVVVFVPASFFSPHVAATCRLLFEGGEGAEGDEV